MNIMTQEEIMDRRNNESKKFNNYNPCEKDLITKARYALSKACHRKFILSIPAEENDPDMVLARLIDGYEILLKEKKMKWFL